MVNPKGPHYQLCNVNRKTNARVSVMSNHCSGFVFLFCPQPSQYRGAEVIRCTEWSGAESLARFGPPASAPGTPSPGFSPGCGLLIQPLAPVAGSVLLPCWAGADGGGWGGAGFRSVAGAVPVP